MKKIIATTLVLALGGLACGKEEGAKPAPEATPATATPTTPDPTPTTPDPATAGTDPAAGDAGAAAAGSADVAPEAATAAEVPTAEDFEEKAAKDVKKENLEQEVQKMEKELGVKEAKKAK